MIFVNAGSLGFAKVLSVRSCGSLGISEASEFRTTACCQHGWNECMRPLSGRLQHLQASCLHC